MGQGCSASDGAAANAQLTFSEHAIGTPRSSTSYSHCCGPSRSVNQDVVLDGVGNSTSAPSNHEALASDRDAWVPPKDSQEVSGLAALWPAATNEKEHNRTQVICHIQCEGQNIVDILEHQKTLTVAALKALVAEVTSVRVRDLDMSLSDNGDGLQDEARPLLSTKSTSGGKTTLYVQRKSVQEEDACPPTPPPTPDPLGLGAWVADFSPMEDMEMPAIKVTFKEGSGIQENGESKSTPRKVSASTPGDSVSWERAAEALVADGLPGQQLRRLLTEVMRIIPFRAAFWECSPLSRARWDSQSFEFVVIHSKELEMAKVNTKTFNAHLGATKGEAGVKDWDTGGDAGWCLAPSWAAEAEDASVYSHILSFFRGAPDEQCNALWLALGGVITDRIKRGNDAQNLLWVFAEGLDVVWCHIRLEAVNPGYRYRPYNKEVPRPEISSEQDQALRVTKIINEDGQEVVIKRRDSNSGAQGGEASGRRSVSTSDGGGTRADTRRAGGALGRPFPKRPLMCKLSQKTWNQLESLFKKMDFDGSNAVTREEADEFFQGSFRRLSTDAMFNEVDVDGSGAIAADEFMQFWVQVRASGYSDQDIFDEIEQLMEGGAWVDWKDGRDTGTAAVKFPKRPLFCRLSHKAWKKCEELFHKMSGNDGSFQITREKAATFFQGTFINMSIEAMFNEVDLHNHGTITAEDFIRFWVQVKQSGYKEKDIIEEIESLLEGGTWVDWKDGRSTA